MGSLRLELSACLCMTWGSPVTFPSTGQDSCPFPCSQGILQIIPWHVGRHTHTLGTGLHLGKPQAVSVYWESQGDPSMGAGQVRPGSVP